MFDVTKFQVTNNQYQAIVKEYDIVEHRPVTLDDIKVSFIDLLIVSSITFLFVVPVVSAVAYYSGLGIFTGCYVGVALVALFALGRYDKTTISFNREIRQVGVMNWEKSSNSTKQSKGANVQFVRFSEHHGREVAWAGLRSEVVDLDTLCNVAKVMVSSGKFNQRLITQDCNLSTETYAKLSQEFVGQGVLKLNGAAKNSGYTITKTGYDLLGSLLSPTQQNDQKLLESA